jgi:integrase
VRLLGGVTIFETEGQATETAPGAGKGYPSACHVVTIRDRNPRRVRHTYATRHLQDGIDIRTLQQWMGHRDIASTMVYLKGVRNRDIQARLNKGSLAAFA